MEPNLSSAQRMALLAIDGGALERSHGVWIATSEAAEHVLPDRVVRWLIGERYVANVVRTPGEPEAFRLTERGRQAAMHARDAEGTIARDADVSAPIERVPVRVEPG